ncbi:MAG: class I SAM-dependent methyltransferase [Prochloraceae cyanobacterium]|nr:class I SAM-dependent methyltransferase [Prochloraceae cyanobacterium]
MDFKQEELHQANIFNIWAEKDYLQSTIDPNDSKGLKCDYIDYWSKFYIKKFVLNIQENYILEIGCGSGRNLFALSPYIQHGYGIDIADKQIQNAKVRQSTLQKNNLEFYTSLNKFMDNSNGKHDINVMFTMWVLAGFSSDNNLQLMLKKYLEAFPKVRKFVFFEQTALETYTVEESGVFFKKVRTKNDFNMIFSKAGLKLKDFKIINEKGFGPIYRLFYMTQIYKYYPKWLNLNRLFFHIDRYIVKRKIASSFTDCVFICEKSL